MDDSREKFEEFVRRAFSTTDYTMARDHDGLYYNRVWRDEKGLSGVADVSALWMAWSAGRASAAAERDALKEKVEQYEEDHRRVIAEKCPTDEIHCSCVPHLRQELEDEHCRYRSAYEDCLDKDDEIRSLRAERDALKRDAERYRAIKKGVSLYIPNPDCYDFDYVLPSDLDAMADAALAAKGE